MKAVREGFQEEVVSALGVQGSRSAREARLRVWGVMAGSMKLEPKRRRQEVVTAGVTESQVSQSTQSLGCFNNLELHSEGSRESGLSCWRKAVTGHPEHVTDEGPKIMGPKSNCTLRR